MRPVPAGAMDEAGSLDGVPIVRLQSDELQVDVAPAVGGRVVSLLHRPTGHEWLWRNRSLPLRAVAPGTPYDPEFYGGIDEQIPCDGRDTIDGVEYPDHGELWTQPLAAHRDGDTLVLRGRLPLLGFDYERRLALSRRAPELRVHYRLANAGGSGRAFLWKLHAALAVAPGDRVVCPATTARPLDPAWSRGPGDAPFPWPGAGDRDASVVPPADGTAELLVLSGLAAGWIGLRRSATGSELRILFDRSVFPCCWVFATYGKLLGHYTVVLEPATGAALTIAESGRPARLEPGEELVTEVRYRVEGAGT